MFHTHHTLGFALTILGLVATLGFAPVALAQGSGDSPITRGVVATVTAINADTNIATLQTEEGEVFKLATASRWHVGHKMLCERGGDSSRPRFWNCQLWESTHPGTAPVGPASRR